MLIAVGTQEDVRFKDLPVPTMQIIGISLVRNEDVHVEWALRNAIPFCDRLIVADHQSQDGTAGILGRLKEEYTDRLEVHRIDDPVESQSFLVPFMGEMAWVFGVDGDEIYDPAGLAKLRGMLLGGAFADWWVVFGNVLNCTEINRVEGYASGFLAPPCRSMTKLYNFNMIESWEASGQRLHGDNIRFKKGYDASRRLDFHQQTSWDESCFRCLHTCFLPRSSRERVSANEAIGGRLNVSESRSATVLRKLKTRLQTVMGRRPLSGWKREKYQRGELVRKDIRNFLPSLQVIQK